MGFQVMHGGYGLYWVPVDNADRTTYETLYEGQLVKTSSDGVVNLGQASGVLDTTGEGQIYGVVRGTNLKTPLFNSTYKGAYVQASDPHGNTTEYTFMGGGGIIPVGDTAAYVQVEAIGPDSVLKGRIFNAAYGTAITVGTVTTASTTGAGFTCSAGLSDASTPVGDLGTVFCRIGANRGIYRITTDTSATVKTVGMYFPYDIATGDTFVNVQMRAWGTSYVQTDAEATFFSSAANPATDYWGIEVFKLDLSTAGSEYVIFRFDPAHFSKVTP